MHLFDSKCQAGQGGKWEETHVEGKGAWDPGRVEKWMFNGSEYGARRIWVYLWVWRVRTWLFSLVNFNHGQSERRIRSWPSVLIFYGSPGLCIICRCC